VDQSLTRTDQRQFFDHKLMLLSVSVSVIDNLLSVLPGNTKCEAGKSKPETSRRRALGQSRKARQWRRRQGTRRLWPCASAGAAELDGRTSPLLWRRTLLPRTAGGQPGSRRRARATRPRLPDEDDRDADLRSMLDLGRTILIRRLKGTPGRTVSQIPSTPRSVFHRPSRVRCVPVSVQARIAPSSMASAAG